MIITGTEVHTRCREAFALEDVAKVSTARRARYFCASHAIRIIILSTDCSWYRCMQRTARQLRQVWDGIHYGTIEERRPATSTVELGCALVQRGTTSRACIHTICVMFIVLPSSGGLGPLLTQNTELCQAYQRQVTLPNAAWAYLFRRQDRPPLAFALGLIAHASNLL